MEVSGKLIVKNEIKTFGAKGFRKREFVVETSDTYPQKVLVELIQDKCDLLEPYNLGDELKISYNLLGREWINPQGEAKYFNSIQGWRIEALQTESEVY